MIAVNGGRIDLLLVVSDFRVGKFLFISPQAVEFSLYSAQISSRTSAAIPWIREP